MQGGLPLLDGVCDPGSEDQQGPGSGVVERRAVSVAAPLAALAFLSILGSPPTVAG